MSVTGKTSALAPFSVRSFRFQWPADLLTSWAFEMETLILGWYVLVETNSVVWLTAFGSLQFIGTLVSPLFGVVGDRLGRRVVLCSMRAFYLILAVSLMALGLADLLTPYHVFAIAFCTGMVRPSDLVMRNSLIGDTMPAERLTNAISLARTTQDSARIAGALAGAALFSVLGIGPAYIFVAGFYGLSFFLTFGVARGRPGSADPAASSRWRDLRDGLLYVWNTPKVLGLMWLAFLVNMTAYPVTTGLMPYVAREVYHLDETGLGRLVATYAAGGLVGSLVMALTGGPRHTARFMLIHIGLWYLAVTVFARFDSESVGLPLLFLIGLIQGVAMIAMSATLLGTVAEAFRARVMGVRMLAVYGLPIGLLCAGFLIDRFDYPSAIAIFAAVGLLFTLLIAVRWRESLWE